jgi:hypothetical protein
MVFTTAGKYHGFLRGEKVESGMWLKMGELFVGELRECIVRLLTQGGSGAKMGT